MPDTQKSKMILRTSKTSPFGRKVRILLLRLGLADDVTIVEPALLDPEDPLRRDNPLGKIPCLVLADGTSIFDSAVIVDYLDRLTNGAIIPSDPAERTHALVEQARGDGLADAAVLIGSERMFHPEEHVSECWLDHQRGKVQRALAAFVAEPAAIAPLGIGAISLACALGYLDWRKPVAWREMYPELVEWLTAFRSAVPEYDQTQA